MAQIFLSYAHADGLAARRLASALEGMGWSVWWDRSLVPGDDWQHVIATELRSAGCVVVLWSEVSRTSTAVREEAALAQVHDKLVPISFDCTLPPEPFSRIEVLDLSRWLGAPSDPNFALLEEGIARKVGRAPSAESGPRGKLDKNRSRLKIWGITIGGTFYGFASGVIAKPALTAAAVIAASLLSIGGYRTYVVSRNQPIDNSYRVSRSGEAVVKSSDRSLGNPETADERTFLEASTKDSAAAYAGYLGSYPNGKYAAEARSRVAKLMEKPAPALPPSRQSEASECSESPGTYRVVGVARGDTLNLRSEPSVNGPIVLRVPSDGRGITLSSCLTTGGTEWCAARYQCRTGWVNRRFLETGDAPGFWTGPPPVLPPGGSGGRVPW